MLKVFLIFYATIGGGIAAVSKPLPSMEGCQAIIERRTIAGWHKQFDMKCVQLPARPKPTVRIEARTKEVLESDCFNLGMPAKCEQLPNGDLRISSDARDKNGNRHKHTIKAKDRLNWMEK